MSRLKLLYNILLRTDKTIKIVFVYVYSHTPTWTFSGSHYDIELPVEPWLSELTRKCLGKLFPKAIVNKFIKNWHLLSPDSMLGNSLGIVSSLNDEADILPLLQVRWKLSTNQVALNFTILSHVKWGCSKDSSRQRMLFLSTVFLIRLLGGSTVIFRVGNDWASPE